MSQFDLYVSLKNTIESESYNFDYNTVCNKINELDSKKSETILALILYHSNLEESKNKNIPYNGKFLNESNNSIIYTFNTLPTILKNIISLFVFSID